MHTLFLFMDLDKDKTDNERFSLDGQYKPIGLESKNNIGDRMT